MEDKEKTVEEPKIDETGKVDTQATNQTEGEEKKYSQEEAQKMADAIVAKKLKGMPTKEELKAYNDWKESQKSAEQKNAEKEQEVAKTASELSEAKKELAVYKAGVNAEEADFVLFKVSKMDGDFEDNLEQFLKDNPKYLNKNEQEETTTTGLQTKKIADKGESGVASILKSKYPDLYK